MAIVVYGAYTTEVHNSRPKGTVCPNCGGEHQIGIHKIIDVIHLMYVPIIPYRIETIAHCNSCGYEFSFTGMNLAEKRQWKPFKSKKRVPIWYFSGPIILILGSLFWLYSQFENEKLFLERLQNGNQKQIIEYQLDDGSYTTLKTLKITSDSVWFVQNKFQTQEYRDIDRINEPNMYGVDTNVLKLDYLKDLINDGKVEMIYAQ